MYLIIVSNLPSIRKRKNGAPQHGGFAQCSPTPKRILDRGRPKVEPATSKGFTTWRPTSSVGLFIGDPAKVVQRWMQLVLVCVDFVFCQCASSAFWWRVLLLAIHVAIPKRLLKVLDQRLAEMRAEAANVPDGLRPVRHDLQWVAPTMPCMAMSCGSKEQPKKHKNILLNGDVGGFFML